MRLRDAVRANHASECPTGETTWFYEHLVPKEYVGNLKFRRRVLDLASESAKLRDDLWIMCSRDILFFINVFGWTLNPKEHPDEPLRPFITYEFQDRVIVALSKCIGKQDVCIPKSRDMGASWMCLMVMEHRWHFRRLQQFLLASEKAELVEGDSEKALFTKLDFWWKNMPWWLTPAMNRVASRKHCENLDMESKFDGEATVDNMATGDRRTAIMLDEAAKMPGFSKILTSTRDVTNCRLFNSTPFGRNGIGEAFYRKVRNPDTHTIWIHWTEHPEKRKGLYKLIGGRRINLDPDKYNWRDDYDFDQLCFTGPLARSAWYDVQVSRSESPMEVAQELNLDFLGSGERFCDEAAVKIIREEQIRKPTWEGRIAVDPEDHTLTWLPVIHGPVRLWCALDADGKPPVDPYVFGSDLSAGVGGSHSSASSLVGFNQRTAEQVFEFATSDILPDDFCDLSIAVATLFGEALLVPEINGGPGEQWLKRHAEVGYSNVYRRSVDAIAYQQQTLKYGDRMPSAGPVNILSVAVSAAKQRLITVRSERILQELAEYEWTHNGKVKHVRSNTSEFGSDKGLLHGDVAIGFGCCYLGMRERPYVPDQAPKQEPGPGTVGYRLSQQDKELAASAIDELEFA